MLTPNTQTEQQGRLKTLAETIQREHRAVGHAAGDMLSHAMAAGDALAAAKAEIKHGDWARWLRREADLSERTAQRYLQLAAARAQLEANASRATDLSIAGALRFLGNTPRPKQTTRAAKPAPVLSTLAWSEASPEVRRRFLGGIGLASLLGALPPAWRAEIEKQFKPRATSPLSEKISKALRVALSHSDSKTDHDRANALASLNAINGLLASQGRDLHDLEIAIAAAAKPKMKRVSAA